MFHGRPDGGESTFGVGMGLGASFRESGFELGLERRWRRRTKGWTGPENSRFLEPNMPQTSTKDR